jgi:uncharacterized linocin/CFP29 family protein
MDDRDAQVGWTDAQWNRVREEVRREWQRVRVAGSFLPVYGPLPRSTQVVPSEVLGPDGTTDDQATAPLLEIALPVRLSRQQVREEDLSSALLQFRRRAAQAGQLEDWYIFNGTYPPLGIPRPTSSTGKAEASRAGTDAEAPAYRPNIPFVNELIAEKWILLRGAPAPIANPETQIAGLRLRNPGALGLMEGAEEDVPDEHQDGSPLDTKGLMRTVVSAMSSLEEKGYVAPYVCVFGRGPFVAAHGPVGASISYTRDRIEPLVGRELLHASAINIPSRDFDDSKPTRDEWENRGVFLSLAGEAIDLAIAVEATPEFRQVDEQGRYVFSVFERFALRIKDPKAIVCLRFAESSRTRRSSGTVDPPGDTSPPGPPGDASPPARPTDEPSTVRPSLEPSTTRPPARRSLTETVRALLRRILRRRGIGDH